MSYKYQLSLQQLIRFENRKSKEQKIGLIKDINKMKKHSFYIKLSIDTAFIVIVSCPSCKKSAEIKDQTVVDIDGNVYNTVTIGSQVWMAEYLKVAHYSNSDSVPNITDNTVWFNLTTSAYCDYNNIPATQHKKNGPKCK
jgi:hypothetical protein